MGISSIFDFASASDDPRLIWLALIIAVVTVFKWISPELKAAFRLIKPISIEKMSAAERQASKEMNAIAQDFGVGRAYISLFHNGTKSAANVHYLKMSIMVEGLSGRVGPIISEMQNRSIAEFGDWGDRIINGKETIVIPDIEDIKDTMPGAYNILKLHLVKSVHILPLYVPNTTKVDGCVFIEHCIENTELNIIDINAIKERAQSVYNGLYQVNNGK